MSSFLPRPYSPPLSDSQDFLDAEEDPDPPPAIQPKEHKHERAEKGAQVKNIKDLQSQLDVHYKEGTKVSDDAYICIPMDAIPK
ncbi:hypothetical protein SERLA73DRAFT_78757 [Serpula lacrymans var. lacrymans S7.3]|uniref:Uncharacterized protein n=1 Tax=Serpula lacrymans var. lacrymans (strain S7.3) TaxID=936435 RepID=F8QE87_SERL3|nr:hypothetical protein SERLA73DRAFT_78757 [Serpula lacrymans var. lacrymans S7.3]